MSTKFEAPTISWRSRRDQAAEPQVTFRILHKFQGDNGDDGPACQSLGAGRYCDQPVHVTVSPNVGFKEATKTTLVRRVPTGEVVCAIPPSQANPRPPKAPRVPRVKELLLQAQEWQKMLNSGEVRNQAEIAQREGITRARVTQIMSLLNLSPHIQHHILNMPKTANRPPVTERALRVITLIENPKEQLDAFRELAKK